MGAPAGYNQIRSYEVWLHGNPSGVSSYNDICVKLHTSGGLVEYQWNYQTEQGLERAKFLVDLLRNEKHVYHEPQQNIVVVFQEEVGEKDRYP